MADVKNERCVLCLDEKRSPVRIQCGHSFCFECLDVYKSYQKYAWANKCPICRSVLKEKKRAVKRKLTSSNATTDHNPRNTATVATSSNTESSSSAALSAHQAEQVFILEELMAIAAGYDHNDHNDLNSSGEQNALIDNDTEYEDDSQDEEVSGSVDNDDVGDGGDNNDDDVEDYDDDDYINDQFYSDSEEDTYYYFNEENDSYDQSSSSYDYGHEIGDDTHEIANLPVDNNNSILVTNLNYNRSSRSRNNTIASSRQEPDTDVVVLDDVIIVD